MKQLTTDVLIIGAGLTGLTLAYLLQKSNINVLVVEARKRLGGRILTKYNTNEAPIELGATWLIDEQAEALELLKTLNISVFEQYYGDTAIYHPNGVTSPQMVQLPKSNSKSYRVAGGTSTIISALANLIDSNVIKTNQIIKEIKLESKGINATSDNYRYNSKYIISTLPPLLLSTSIKITPNLLDDISVLLANTHTWMHDSIRIGLTYKVPFWKSDKTSGTIYSSQGPIQEFYDHSNVNVNLFALSGFITSSYFEMPRENRKTEVLKQLHSYYGKIVLDYLSYEECLWKNEDHTSITSEHYLMPQTNNGHHFYNNTYLNDRLFIAGTETSNVFPGKMEGAIRSANEVFVRLKEKL